MKKSGFSGNSVPANNRNWHNSISFQYWKVRLPIWWPITQFETTEIDSAAVIDCVKSVVGLTSDNWILFSNRFGAVNLIKDALIKYVIDGIKFKTLLLHANF